MLNHQSLSLHRLYRYRRRRLRRLRRPIPILPLCQPCQFQVPQAQVFLLQLVLVWLVLISMNVILKMLMAMSTAQADVAPMPNASIFLVHIVACVLLVSMAKAICIVKVSIKPSDPFQKYLQYLQNLSESCLLVFHFFFCFGNSKKCQLISIFRTLLQFSTLIVCCQFFKNFLRKIIFFFF